MNPYKKQRHKGQGQGKPRRRKLATPARKDPSELPDKTKLHLKAAPRSAELGHHFVYSELPFLLQDLPDTALVIILDHITDVGNFGAIIRSAEV
ncbi:MAG: hypothetical protein LBL67_05825, partial [Coriobacteriales bacterium]|nr:hypothetical protein [Coriobacteriales bacterium]